MRTRRLCRTYLLCIILIFTHLQWLTIPVDFVDISKHIHIGTSE